MLSKIQKTHADFSDPTEATEEVAAQAVMKEATRNQKIVPRCTSCTGGRFSDLFTTTSGQK